MRTSLALHILLAVLLLTLPSVTYTSPADVPRASQPVARLTLHQPLRPHLDNGGGRTEAAPATRGSVPQVTHPVFLPPTIQRVAEPRLILDSGVDTAVPRIDLPTIGDPLGAISGGPPSSGRGAGPSIGDGDRDDAPGGIRAPALGATPPVLVHKVEPDYSDEARKNHFQGSVLLAVDIDEQGRVTNVRVLRPLGLGLDEKAVEAVQRWRFQPARKAGRAIAYPAAIEVRFQLL